MGSKENTDSERKIFYSHFITLFFSYVLNTEVDNILPRILSYKNYAFRGFLFRVHSWNANVLCTLQSTSSG